MQQANLAYPPGFHLTLESEHAQAATIVLDPGGTMGGPQNIHERGEQWLYVVEGGGELIVEGDEITLVPGVLVVIGVGETHEIRNSGRETLRLLNFYAPPEDFG